MASYNLSPKEAEKAETWQTQHECMYSPGPDGLPQTGPIGGRWSFVFTPTSIGVAVEVRCACGAEEDITDYCCW